MIKWEEEFQFFAQSVLQIAMIAMSWFEIKTEEYFLDFQSWIHHLPAHKGQQNTLIKKDKMPASMT